VTQIVYRKVRIVLDVKEIKNHLGIVAPSFDLVEERLGRGGGKSLGVQNTQGQCYTEKKEEVVGWGTSYQFSCFYGPVPGIGGGEEAGTL